MSIFRRRAYLSKPVFPNDQCMIQNYEWVTDPFKIQDRTLGFNVAEYEKLIDIVSDFTLQLTFRKLSVSRLGVVSKENTHNN